MSPSTHVVAADVISMLGKRSIARRQVEQEMKHIPQFNRYLALLMESGLIKRKGDKLSLTNAGLAWLKKYLAALREVDLAKG